MFQHTSLLKINTFSRFLAKPIEKAVIHFNFQRFVRSIKICVAFTYFVHTYIPVVKAEHSCWICKNLEVPKHGSPKTVTLAPTTQFVFPSHMLFTFDSAVELTHLSLEWEPKTERWQVTVSSLPQKTLFIINRSLFAQDNILVPSWQMAAKGNKVISISSKYNKDRHSLPGAPLGEGGVLPCPNFWLKFFALFLLEISYFVSYFTWFVPSTHEIITLK